jgi:hypothetical protein
MNFIALFLFALPAVISLSETKSDSEREICVLNCQDFWSKKYHECRKVKECEAWATTEFMTCAGACK